jgi:hypothetical protein
LKTFFNGQKFSNLPGMHKKSIEAAETLKSSDENSDNEKDEERTEISDTSSLHRRSPTTPTSTTGTPGQQNKPKPVSNGSPCSSSISPVTMSPPISHQPTTPTQRSADEAVKGKDYSLMSSPTSRPPYHLSPHEQQPPQNAQHPANLVHHHTHPAHHYPLNPMNPSPDTDPTEVFRWVNYNRDYPTSFIR